MNGQLGLYFELFGQGRERFYEAPGKDTIPGQHVLEAGAEDLTSDEDFYQITCAPQDFDKVKTGLSGKDVKLASAELSMVPKNSIKVETAEAAKKVLALIEDLEDNDDVSKVYANFDIPDEELEALG